MCKSSKFLTALIMILALSLLTVSCKKSQPTTPTNNPAAPTDTAGTETGSNTGTSDSGSNAGGSTSSSDGNSGSSSGSSQGSGSGSGSGSEGSGDSGSSSGSTDTGTTTKEITEDTITKAFRALGTQQFTDYSIAIDFSSINIGENTLLADNEEAHNHMNSDIFKTLMSQIQEKLSGVKIEGATVSVNFTKTPSDFIGISSVNFARIPIPGDTVGTIDPLTAEITIIPQDGYTLTSDKITINIIPSIPWKQNNNN